MLTRANDIDVIPTLSVVGNEVEVPVGYCTRSSGERTIMVQTQRLFELESIFFLGDNLEMLRRFVPSESVDLVYLDPPFKSNANYNMLFKHVDGTPVSAQIKAFDDTWRWSLESELAYKEMIESGGDVSRALRSFRELLGPSNMLAYLAMMAPRLVELRRVLRPIGSIYLHCDPTASHYLKVLMDAIFGPTNFRNEITWRRTSTVKGNAAGQNAKHFGRNTDSILFYAMSDKATFNPLLREYDEGYIEKRFTHVEPNTGRRFQTVSMGGPGGAATGHPMYEVMGVSRFWRFSKIEMQRLLDEGRVYQGRPGDVPRQKYYLDEAKGIEVQALWTDIDSINSQAAERLGYPTQKPIALLERIIATSSNPGDTVLDPFCGCGTTIDAAQKLGRRWIGIDITNEALKVIDKRLHDNYPGFHFDVKIIPTTLEEVEVLAARDKYGYQQWVCDLLGIKAEIHKGADRGIDGEVVRYEVGGGEPVRTIVSVKGGGVNVSQIRDLRGTMYREGVDTGIFVSHRQPTSAMQREALAAGVTDAGIPKIQMLTSVDLIEGRGPQLPVPIQVGYVASGDEVVSPPTARVSRPRG